MALEGNASRYVPNLYPISAKSGLAGLLGKGSILCSAGASISCSTVASGEMPQGSGSGITTIFST